MNEREESKEEEILYENLTSLKENIMKLTIFNLCA